MPDQVWGPDLPEDLQALQWEATAALSAGGTAIGQRLFPGRSEGQNSRLDKGWSCRQFEVRLGPSRQEGARRGGAGCSFQLGHR